MSAFSIARALDEHLQAMKLTNVAFENAPFTPTKGQMYLSSLISGRDRIPLGFGANAVTQYSGSYQVNVNGPVDEGVQPGLRLADRVAEHFRRGTTLRAPDETRISVEISSVQAAITVGDWFTIPVVVRWFATEP